MDKLPTELIVKIANRCHTVCDRITFIGAITHNDQLLEKYKDKELTQNEIRIIKYFITFDYIPYSYLYFERYKKMFLNAYVYKEKDSNLLKFKPNYANIHSTSSIRNRRDVHNFFKIKLKKELPFETNKLFILIFVIKTPALFVSWSAMNY